jgi:hypothetical protein
MRWPAILLLCLISAAPAAARNSTIKGSVAVMAEAGFGCKKYADWLRFVTLMGENDAEAAMLWRTRALIPGRCKVIWVIARFSRRSAIPNSRQADSKTFGANAVAARS